MKFRSDLTKEENNPVKKKIVSRLDSSKVLFEYEGELKGANLSGADLSGADLRSADLSGATLRGTDLTGADLTKVIL